MFSLFSKKQRPTKEWSSKLNNPIFRGLHPVMDPFDSNCFYIADGWGSAFPSIKLRRLSLQSGVELNSVYTKNAVRCLTFQADRHYIFAALDSRILQLDRSSLTLKMKFDQRIQKYTDYVASNDDDTLLMMNYLKESLFIFNYKTGQSFRKKIGSCCGIVRKSENEFFIFDGFHGRIVVFDLKNNSATELLKMNIFHSVQVVNYDHHNVAFIRLGQPRTDSGNVTTVHPLNRIIIVDLGNLKAIDDFLIGKDFVSFSVRNDALCLQDWSAVHVYSLSKKKVVRTTAFDSNETVLSVFFNEGRIFTETSTDDKLHVLNCYELTNELAV